MFLGLDQILETFNNGAPRIIRTYSTYGNKIILTKEVGYYFEGQIEYQKNYRNGELVSTNKWNRDGKKENNVITPYNSFNANTSRWPLESISQMIEECVADGNRLQECNCAIEKFQNEYTWDEWKNSVENESVNDKDMQRMMNVVIEILTDCGISF